MKTHSQSPRDNPKNAALSAWLESLDNVARSIRSYAAEASTLRRECDLDGNGPKSDGAGAPQVDVFSEVDKRIEEMRDLEVQLFICRAAMQEFRNRCTALVPINRLPPECISQIFIMGANPEPPDKDDPDAYEPHWYPEKPFCLTVSTVCRRWRDVALHTPRLWSCIEFLDVAPFKYSELMLERSRGCPLYIHVDYSALQAEDTAALRLLRRYISNRQISLSIILSHEGGAESTLAELSVPGESPPRITELVVVGDRQNGWVYKDLNDPEDDRVLMPMSGIRYLYVIATYLPRCIISAYANLVDLRLVDIAGYGTAIFQFKEILRSCHQLAFLRASGVDFISVDRELVEIVDPRGPIVMRSLRAIEIFDARDSSINYFLRTLGAPVLEVLRIQGKIATYDDNHPTPEIGQSLTSFLATSSQCLRNVSLDAVEISQDNLVPILEHLPHISSLRLSRMDGTTQFLEILASHRLCLELEQLVIANIKYGHKSSISIPLRKLVQPDDRPSLSRLVIRKCKDFDPPDIDWLRANALNFTCIGFGGGTGSLN
ncbi:hypothetical protein BOTBODRAFT_27833 [Botryobasidium botryosum FD-172 SS1]|uniref:Uncharacterized protein n=1 Tax=Botryobasidium botryosum (strain FD-172 SS1) TaxID=930990 RepID=A0A067MU32_BOTB1|nr:hypothetical protein BOTBODRAFT_27833 [Botryobasidium botryosum FD-172 SS1]